MASAPKPRTPHLPDRHAKVAHVNPIARAVIGQRVNARRADAIKAAPKVARNADHVPTQDPADPNKVGGALCRH